MSLATMMAQSSLVVCHVTSQQCAAQSPHLVMTRRSTQSHRRAPAIGGPSFYFPQLYLDERHGETCQEVWSVGRQDNSSQKATKEVQTYQVSLAQRSGKRDCRACVASLCASLKLQVPQTCRGKRLACFGKSLPCRLPQQTSPTPTSGSFCLVEKSSRSACSHSENVAVAPHDKGREDRRRFTGS